MQLPPSTRDTNNHNKHNNQEIQRCSVVSWLVVSGFLLGMVRDDTVPCRYCGDGHLFLECIFLPSVSTRENPLQTVQRADPGRECCT